MIQLHTFDDQRAQSDALAKATGDALQACLAARHCKRHVARCGIGRTGAGSQRRL